MVGPIDPPDPLPRAAGAAGGQPCAAPAEIPWQELAFRTVAHTLRLFFTDRAHGEFGTHLHTIDASPTLARAERP